MIIYTVDHNFVLDQLIEKINLKDQKISARIYNSISRNLSMSLMLISRSKFK